MKPQVCDSVFLRIIRWPNNLVYLTGDSLYSKARAQSDLPILKKIIPSFSVAFIFCLVFFIPIFAFSQSSKDLEKRRKRLLKSIRNTTRLLNETKRDKVAALDRFNTLQQQIKKREELILTLQEEVEFSKQNIDRSSDVVNALQEDMSRLEEEYAIMARKAFRQKATRAEFAFLFSAQSFNQFVKRWQYLKQYDRYRKKQANLIFETREMLQGKIQKLEERKIEKEALIESEAEQQILLAEELESKSQILNILRKDEQRLRKNLNKQQTAHRNLNEAIKNIIEKQTLASKRSAKKASPAKREKARKIEGKMTGSFRNQRGRLSWPVAEGVVTKRFGRQPHPTIKKIEITNNGIDIRTFQKGKVRAVFPGKVAGTQFIPGYNHTLIVKHGEYYTVYSNLQEVFVKRDEPIKANQTIGRLAVDPKSGKSELHFEVWRNKVRLYPIDWLGRQ